MTMPNDDNIVFVLKTFSQGPPTPPQDPIDNTRDLYIRIPRSTVTHKCLRPLKWLEYVAWAALGERGSISTSRNGGPTDIYSIRDSQTETDLTRPYYYFVSHPDQHQDIAVHPEIIINPSDFPSSSSMVEGVFQEEVKQRDQKCVFTGMTPVGCQVHRLVPRVRGSTWLQEVDRQRGGGVVDVDDVRNGIFITATLHRNLYTRAAILPTPNVILDCADIPGQTMPNPPYRYTCQWIETPGHPTIVPHNCDARFSDVSPEHLPSATLLHYIYGTLVLMHYGCGVEWLKGFEPPSPPPPDAMTTSSDLLSRSNLGIGRNKQATLFDAMDLVQYLYESRPEVQRARARAEEERRRAREHAKEAANHGILEWRQNVHSAPESASQNASDV